MDEPTLTVTLPVRIIEDLVQMARKSPQYREGYHWTVVAMHEVSKALNVAKIAAKGEK